MANGHPVSITETKLSSVNLRCTQVTKLSVNPGPCELKSRESLTWSREDRRSPFDDVTLLVVPDASSVGHDGIRHYENGVFGYDSGAVCVHPVVAWRSQGGGNMDVVGEMLTKVEITKVIARWFDIYIIGEITPSLVFIIELVKCVNCQ